MVMSIKPTAIETRVSEIDVLRGVALLGVLLVNLTMIDSTLFGAAHWAPDGRLNVYAKYFIEFFAQGKFYTQFSFLFGLGFYFFISRNADVIGIEKAYRRRLGALLFFGCLHLVFVWFGDILHSYALCGYALYLNRNRSNRALLTTAIALGCTSLVFYGILHSSGPSGFDYQSAYASAITAYTSTDYFTMLTYRVSAELPLILQNIFIVTPKLLSLFFLGYFVGKVQFFKQLPKHYNFIKKLCISSGLVFLATIVAMILVIKLPLTGFIGGFINGFSKELSTYAGSCFYTTLIVLGMSHPLITRLLAPFQFSGRMALTNYLTQTIFFTWLFYGYGAGLLGKVHYTMYLPVAFAFYSVQIAISWMWLKRFKWGPMEWIWRQWTYGVS